MMCLALLLMAIDHCLLLSIGCTLWLVSASSKRALHRMLHCYYWTFDYSTNYDNEFQNLLQCNVQHVTTLFSFKWKIYKLIDCSSAFYLSRNYERFFLRRKWFCKIIPYWKMCLTRQLVDGHIGKTFCLHIHKFFISWAYHQKALWWYKRSIYEII